MRTLALNLLLGSAAVLAAHAATAETLTIATVNNGDMIRMQKLTDDFKAKNPGIDVQWVTLEENVLRQKVTTDIATKSGQFDILTIGTYEAPIWSKLGWLTPLESLGANYDVDDLLPSIRTALSMDGKLYAAPFYAESSMTMYRKDLFEKAGLTMPDNPTWSFIADAARKLTDRKADINGICLRGKAGWGENMGFINTLGHSFGANYFAEDFTPQFDKPIWHEVAKYYVDLMKDAGPVGATSNGFNETLALFQQGKCAIWVDATSAASFVSDAKQSKVADKVAFAVAPNEHGINNRGNWLWAWSLAIPSSSQKTEAAQKFIAWATNKEYTELVASKDGWLNVPPGTRKSLYDNKNYLNAAPFAKYTLAAIQAVTNDIPHDVGNFPSIPEYQGIGTFVGQQFAAALAGDETVDQALKKIQDLTVREMKKAGYPK
ncbi:ABC transporter substrate-binding protein [Agrobacterium tumefaciens]|uniref:ABC transporter substrate-binding protein n=1 Tax=Agrobacterium tumefaciens TaxID=358 RepID=UPI0009D5617C|nr:sugar ABC transporter substrate-binding protein [Agrobacterium tumefaciens]AYM19954.1 sorbitol/mannitol transport system substrate-binding protein [Agrobacterium tumefaciens]AYM71257.1 sorbitol/mannitol transport system substrate-binding protein [Agrobacterium tumefaciens]CUX06313.1 putative ABC transporter, periplasmic binding protein [Agrobacterium fabacearum TT111]